MKPDSSSITRRHFVQGSAGVAAAALASSAFAKAAEVNRISTIRYGVIGCGGRGTGAAVNALEASKDVQIVALADAFKDRLDGCREELAKQEDAAMAARAKIADDRCYVGLDAYRKLIASQVDVVILATAPHFRSIHLAEAIEHGKHVFMEKPVGTDPRGVRSVLDSGAKAASKNLSIVAGTQRRHEKCYREAMERVKNGDIGKIVSANCYWNQGGLWVKPREKNWSEMEWHIRNWLYFTWTSGDHICEQHVHNLDVCNWAIGSHPLRAMGMGGRQVRTGPDYGQIFDHFAIEYEYADGVKVSSQCRQIDGCASRVEEVIRGTKGVLMTASGRAEIVGEKPWKFSGDNPNPYVVEHQDLLAAIGSNRAINESKNVAESTLTAILGRMSAYTGKEVSWEQAFESKLDLAPPKYEFGPVGAMEVAVPGKTPLV